MRAHERLRTAQHPEEDHVASGCPFAADDTLAEQERRQEERQEERLRHHHHAQRQRRNTEQRDERERRGRRRRHREPPLDVSRRCRGGDAGEQRIRRLEEQDVLWEGGDDPPEQGKHRWVAGRKMRGGRRTRHIQPAEPVSCRQGLGEDDIHAVVVDDTDRQRIDEHQPDGQHDGAYHPRHQSRDVDACSPLERRLDVDRSARHRRSTSNTAPPTSSSISCKRGAPF